MLKFCSTGVHLGSRDLLEFWEISANISETVQDRDIVTVENYNKKSPVASLFKSNSTNIVQHFARFQLTSCRAVI